MNDTWKINKKIHMKEKCSVINYRSIARYFVNSFEMFLCFLRLIYNI